MKARVWPALITVYILWGSTYLAIRFAVESLPPFTMAAIRFLVAGSVLYAAMRLTGAKPTRSRHWVTTGTVGVLLLVTGNGVLSWAEQSVPSGVAALLIGATPLWMVLIDWLRPGGVKPDRRVLIGVAVGFIGIAWLISPSDFLGNSESIDLLGGAAVIFASMSWALGSIYGRDHKADAPESPLLSTAMEMLVGGVVLFAVGALSGEWGKIDPSAVAPRSLAGLGYLILFGSLIAYSAYNWLLREAPMPLVSTYAYVNPLVAVFLGYLFAREPLSMRVIGAAVIIVGSVFLINSARSASPEKAVAAKTPPRVESAVVDAVVSTPCD